MLLTWWLRKGLDTPALINTFDQKLPDQFHLFIPCKLSFYSKPSCYVAVTVCVPAAPPSPSVAWQPAGRAWRPAATAPCCAAPAGPGCSWATLPQPRRSAPCWRSDLQMERWDSAAGHRYGAQTGPKKLFKRKKNPENWKLLLSFKYFLSVSKFFQFQNFFLLQLFFYFWTNFVVLEWRRLTAAQWHLVVQKMFAQLLRFARLETKLCR